MSTIQDNALLVRFSASQWSGKKYDRTVSEKVARDHEAARDAGRYTKNLLGDDAKTYKALVSRIGEARQNHYRNTLPWSDEGIRLLPMTNYEPYKQEHENAWREIGDLITEFERNYPELRHRGRLRLGAMFNETDWPNVSEIRSKFSIAAEYLPVPSGTDIRVNVSDAERRRLMEQIDDRVRSNTETAMQDAWQRLYSVVSNMESRLSNPESVFRDTLVSNVEDVCNVLRRLNITGDAELERLRAQAQERLTAVSAERLRNFTMARNQVASSAADILSQIRGTRRITTVERTEVA